MLSRVRAEAATVNQVAIRQLVIGEGVMNQVIWIVGAVVIILFILGFLGLR
jgi:hypothetical protein